MVWHAALLKCIYELTSQIKADDIDWDHLILFVFLLVLASPLRGQISVNIADTSPKEQI